MVTSASPVLKVPSLPKAAARLARRLRRTLGSSRPEGPASRPAEVLDPLQEAGRQLRLGREARGLGLRQLAQDTRISTAVLEALERGWRDRLPEPTYLRTMLPLLERHLGLPPLSLQGALPALPNRFQATPSRPPLLRRFTPGSIEVFTSWQGTLLYGLVTLALVHLLNLQQFRLAERGLLSARPMPELANPRAAATAQTDAALLDAFPDLQPTSQAAAGLGLRRLRQEGGGGAVDLSLGVLELSAPSPTRVELRSSRGGDSRLVGVQGELALPVLPPFQLRLDPEPGGGTVRWRGQPLAPITGKPGSFRYPPAAAAPAAPRP